MTALHVCVIKGHMEVARALIEAGSDLNVKIDDEGWTLLHICAQNGHFKVARILIVAGADLNAKVLQYSSRTKRLGYGPRFVAYNPGVTPLHVCAKNGQLEVARALIEAGADVNAMDDSSRTPLHCCVPNGHSEVTRALIEAGADVDADILILLLVGCCWGLIGCARRV